MTSPVLSVTCTCDSSLCWPVSGSQEWWEMWDFSSFHSRAKHAPCAPVNPLPPPPTLGTLWPPCSVVPESVGPHAN